MFLTYLLLTYLLTYLLTDLLTHSIEQNPSWEANQFSDSQEIPCIVWNPKVHYPIHKCPSPVHILSQLNPVDTPHPTSWRCILILSSYMTGSPQQSLSLRFPHQNPVHTSILPHMHYIPHPSHIILLDLITQTILGEEYRSFSSSLCSFLHSPVTLSL
jgi:hypothetical protein